MEFFYVLANNKYLNGYADNEYIFRKYLKQLNIKNNSNFIINSSNFLSEKEFLESMCVDCRLVNEFYKDNKLYPINNHSFTDSFIINNEIYHDFTSWFIRNGYYKLLAMIYIHYGNNGIKLTNYLHPKYRNMIFRITELLMNKYYPEIKEYQKDGMYELYNDIENDKIGGIWEIIELYDLIKEYFVYLVNYRQYMQIFKY